MKLETIEALKEIKTPIAFLSLVVLIVEAVLLYLMTKVTGINLTILICGMVLLPFACLFVLYLLYGKPSHAFPDLAVKDDVPPPSRKKYDLFVSAPMAAFESEKEFQSVRNSVFDVVRGIKKNCKFANVFYAGDEIESQKEFDSDDVSVVEDYDACYRSKYFILIYPKKLATSSLIELGWAMAHKTPIVIFTKSRQDLPFLSMHADAVFTNVVVHEYKTSSDITDYFYPNGAKIFKHLANATKNST